MIQNDFQSNLVPGQRNKINSGNIIDVPKLFFLFIHNWYFFLITLLLTVFGAYLFNRYTIPVYDVNSTLLIEEGQQSSYISTNQLTQGFGLNPALQSIDNQINILSSYTLIQRSLNELDFGIEYYVRGKINKTSLYSVCPFNVSIDSFKNIPYNIEFSLIFLKNDLIKIVAKKDDIFIINKKVKLGEVINVNKFEFHIEKNINNWDSYLNQREIFFVFHSQSDLVLNYKNRLKVVPISKEGSIVELSLQSIDPIKDKIFLQKLIEVFIGSNLAEKNLEAERTINFINNQLQKISDSLVIAGNKLQEFRSKNRIMNISDQGTQVLEQAVRLEDEKSRLMLQSDYFNYLNRYLKKDLTKDKVAAPSTIGISDPSLVRLVAQLSQLQSEYFSLGGGERNPLKMNLRIKIENTKSALIETLKSIIRNNDYAIKSNKDRLRELNRKAESLPATERKLLGIERGYKINDALFTFLLQKRAEAQIQKASNSSDTKVIDKPRIVPHPISPKPRLNYFLALVLGLFLPGISMILYDILNTRVVSDDDIKEITGMPITGHILYDKKSDKKYSVIDNPKTDIANSLRALRTRLSFFIKDRKNPIILVSSSFAGEGKTFISINLASIYSLQKKKTVLVGFDLRRPKLHDLLNLPNTKGVSTFLIGENNISDIIQPSGHAYLDVILSGPVPPNPAELIDSEKSQELLNELRKKYDYIILDSAPIGISSDTFPLAAMADTCIIVARYKKTLKQMLKITISEMIASEVKSISIVANGLSRKNSAHNYAYIYKYNK